MSSHIRKLKDAAEHWILLLFSDCMIWDWECLGSQAQLLNTVENQSKIICVEKLNAEVKKKITCFLKQTSPLNSELFPSIFKYSAFGKALSIMMGYSREYLRGRSFSVQEFDIFNPRRALIVFSALGSKAIKSFHCYWFASRHLFHTLLKSLLV